MRACKLLMIQLLSWAPCVLSAPTFSGDAEKLRGKRLHSDLSSEISGSDALALSLSPELEGPPKLARFDLLQVECPVRGLCNSRGVEGSPAGSVEGYATTTILGLDASRIGLAMSSGRIHDDGTIGSEDLKYFSSSPSTSSKDYSLSCKFHEDHNPQGIKRRKLNQLLKFYSFFGMNLSKSKGKENSDSQHRGHGLPAAVKQELDSDPADELGSFPDQVAEADSLQPSQYVSLQEPTHMNESRPVNPEITHNFQPAETLDIACPFDPNFSQVTTQLEREFPQPHDESQQNSPRRAEQSQDYSRNIEAVLEGRYDFDPHSQPFSGLKWMAPPPLKLKLYPNVNPQATPDDELDRYVSVFVANIKILSERFNKFMDSSKVEYQGKAQAKNCMFENISAVHVSFPSYLHLPSCIRLRSSDTLSSRLYARPSKIILQIKFLLKWVIFNHNTLHYRLGNSKPYTKAAQEALVNWLLKEFFAPDPQQSLPVMGEGKYDISDHSRNAFGRVQIFLIEYILSAREAQAKNHTACDIIGIWYQKFEPEHWESFFVNNISFLHYITQAVELSPEARPAFRRRASAPPSSPSHIEDFQIIILKTCQVVRPSISSELVQKWCDANQAAQSVNMEKKIMEDAEYLYQHCVKGKLSRDDKFENVSIGLGGCGENENNVKVYVLRLIRMDKRVIPPTGIKRFLKTWLGRLKNCHTFFLAFAEHTGKLVEYNAHFQLLSWLQNELFYPKNGLAIFGTVPEDFDNCNETAFTQLQLYIIKSLTEFYISLEFDQIFSTIIGFWYKNHLPCFWNSNFKEDKDYWNFMAQVIRLKNCKY